MVSGMCLRVWWIVCVGICRNSWQRSQVIVNGFFGCLGVRVCCVCVLRFTCVWFCVWCASVWKNLWLGLLKTQSFKTEIIFFKTPQTWTRTRRMTSCDSRGKPVRNSEITFSFLLLMFLVHSVEEREDPFPWQHLIKNSDCLFRFFFFQEGFNENPSVSVSPPFYPFFSSYKQSFFSLTFFSLLLLLLLCPSVVDFFATYHWQTHHLSLSPSLPLSLRLSLFLTHTYTRTHTHTYTHTHARMHAHAHAQARTRGKKSQREQQVLNFDAVEKNWHPEFLMKYRWKEIVFDGDGGRKIVGDWKWFFGGPCTLQLLTGGIQCWYRMMVLNERIKRGWSRTKLVLSVLISSQLRFWIFSVLLAFLKLMPAQTGFSIGARRPSGLDYWLLTLLLPYPTLQRSKRNEGWASGSNCKWCVNAMSTPNGTSMGFSTHYQNCFQFKYKLVSPQTC